MMLPPSPSSSKSVCQYDTILPYHHSKSVARNISTSSGSSFPTSVSRSSCPIFADHLLPSSSSSSSSTPQLVEVTNSPFHINNDDSNTTKIRIHSSIISSSCNANQPIVQLVFGAVGVYCTYIYYARVQEDLFRYRDSNNIGFTYVWFLQVIESSISILFGWLGRFYYRNKSKTDRNMPLVPFFQAGASQLFGKVFMSLSLTYGITFPVVVLAKSGKVIPVMIGQAILGGSKYHVRDYIFSILLVIGTFMLSMNSSHASTNDDDEDDSMSNSTTIGVIFLVLSLCLDGLTGGLQKKLKNETVVYEPNAYDFLYYSHITMCMISLIICSMTNEFHLAISYSQANPTIWIWLMASCLCSSIGQCFIFYLIAKFDPFVCTSITTSRKMISVLLSIFWVGHVAVSGQGMIGLLLAFVALLIEIEGKVRYHHTGNSMEGGDDRKTVNHHHDANAVTTVSNL